MYVNHVAMNMIQLLEIQIMVLHRELLLKTCRTTGYVRFVEWEKRYLFQKKLNASSGQNDFDLVKKIALFF